MAVFRCFTEKKPGFNVDAAALCRELTEILGVSGLEDVRIFCRYDMEGVDRATYAAARQVVFSEPQCDLCYDEELPSFSGEYRMLAVEPLPGQYDQRSDSFAQ